MKIIYDKSYPPNTTDYTPIVRALQIANADLVIVCSYPLSSVGHGAGRERNELKPKMFGGGMVGLQGIAVKSKLGPKLNGIINYETWVPSEKIMAPAAEFFKKYQARAAAEGADPLGSLSRGMGQCLHLRAWRSGQWCQQHR